MFTVKSGTPAGAGRGRRNPCVCWTELAVKTSSCLHYNISSEQKEDMSDGSSGIGLGMKIQLQIRIRIRIPMIIRSFGPFGPFAHIGARRRGRLFAASRAEALRSWGEE